MFNLYSAMGSGTLSEYMNINYSRYLRFIGSEVLQATLNPIPRNTHIKTITSRFRRFIVKLGKTPSTPFVNGCTYSLPSKRDLLPPFNASQFPGST